MSKIDEIEALLRQPHTHFQANGRTLIRRQDLAALCRYVRAAEVQMTALRGPLSIEFQTARRELGIE